MELTERQLSDEYDAIMGRADWQLHLDRIKEINKQIEKIWLIQDRQGKDPFLASYLGPSITLWRKIQNKKDEQIGLEL